MNNVILIHERLFLYYLYRTVLFRFWFYISFVFITVYRIYWIQYIVLLFCIHAFCFYIYSLFRSFVHSFCYLFMYFIYFIIYFAIYLICHDYVYPSLPYSQTDRRQWCRLLMFKFCTKFCMQSKQPNPTATAIIHSQSYWNLEFGSHKTRTILYSPLFSFPQRLNSQTYAAEKLF